jgi:hypothetical protein
MKRHVSSYLQPSLEPLERRETPSVAPLLSPGGDAIVVASEDPIATPIKVSGEGLFPSGLPLTPGGTSAFSATGTASRLGRFASEGTFTLGSLSISPTGEVIGTFEGAATFVAANGDRLAFTVGSGFSGTFRGQLSADGTSLEGVIMQAIFAANPTASTGRFARVTADGGVSMLMGATNISLISSTPGYTAPFSFAWEGAGSLTYGKPNA